jgi:hypothetical protein
MVNKGIRRAVLYFAALLAVSFGMDWGFVYILSVHGERSARKRQAADPSPGGAQKGTPISAPHGLR